MTTKNFTLNFALNPVARHTQLNGLDASAREREFVREQIAILLRYVTLYAEGKRLDPDAFAIVNEPNAVFPLEREDR